MLLFLIGIAFFVYLMCKGSSSPRRKESKYTQPPKRTEVRTPAPTPVQPQGIRREKSPDLFSGRNLPGIPQREQDPFNEPSDGSVPTASSEIQRYLKQNGIHCLYHFTPESNLNSIRRMKGLFSWKFLRNRRVNYSGGGDELSRTLDERRNLENYVRLSF